MALLGDAWAIAPISQKADLAASVSDGTLQIVALSERAFRVRFTPAKNDLNIPPSAILQADQKRPRLRRASRRGITQLKLSFLQCEVDTESARVRFFDNAGNLLLSEVPGARRLMPTHLEDGPALVVEQAFHAPEHERLYGTGCFQDGALNIRCLPRRLTQVNTQISLPFVLSSRGYGLLWHNSGMSELNPPSHSLVMTRTDAGGDAQTVNVTTTSGNAQVTRHLATFVGRFEAATSGRYAFLLDIGRKMASRHYVEIDGKPYVDLSNLWLPPTTSFIAELSAGAHEVRVIANNDDVPTIFFDRTQDRTVWRSPVADAIDYVVIAGPTADDVMSGFRQLAGPTPMMPRWAFGYIHCRERFHSSDEIIKTTEEFRRRKLPVDVMVQDWQYWGKYGWNAMRFDETFYPDPAGLIDKLHSLNARFMLSVWSKISQDTELGKIFKARDFYIANTDWIDFFNRDAAAYYAECQNRLLGSLGVDAWWQDATEPENDDLLGRRTAVGRGERVRLAYPLQVTRTVYEAQRHAFPDRRVMILTRSAFVGQQRYAAATWSGDIGNDWETLKRQIPAGLNMAAAGYPYWTVDAGGFFRPGSGQYTDRAYQHRFLRWFQYATFLPLQRVHGYQTDTEFWRYGQEVEEVSRQYLELRYRLLPYVYSAAASVTRTGAPLMRPLVFDFPHDAAALDQAHSYMFGPALHVCPVLAADVEVWPVYLPKTQGGWFDFWTGEHRAGGQTYKAAASITRVPVHIRAGSILPLGPVVQSTAEANGEHITLHIAPGRDGDCELYEDNGLNYDYEKGRFSLIRMHWDDKHRELRLGAREGRFDGMLQSRALRVCIIGPGRGPLNADPGIEVIYTGAPQVVRRD